MMNSEYWFSSYERCLSRAAEYNDRADYYDALGYHVIADNFRQLAAVNLDSAESDKGMAKAALKREREHRVRRRLGRI